MLYSSSNGTQLTLTHDANEKNIYTLVYRPEVWTPSKEVIQGNRLYIPTIPNGCMYSAVQGGITGLVEPIWNTGKSTITANGSVKFQATPYNLVLQTGDTISADVANSIAAYQVITPVGVTVDSTALSTDGASIRFRIVSSPSSGTFAITIRVSILKASGLYVIFDDTINFIITSNQRI